MKKTTYVLIADGARARLFVVEEGTADLKPALGQEFIGTNLPSREIASDRPGRSFDSAGSGRHAMEPPTDPHRHAERVFAQEVAAVLENALRRNEFHNLVVVAPPKALGDLRGKALGDLRGEFSDVLRNRVTAELNKDLTKVAIHDLPSHLAEILRT
jgi:protein required for attachment to host cells